MALEVINLIPEGFRTYGTKTIGYVKDNKLYLNSPELRIMVESEAQIASIADQLPPGTKFFLAGDQATWQSGSNGDVSKFEIPGTFYLDPGTMNLYYNSEVE